MGGTQRHHCAIAERSTIFLRCVSKCSYSWKLTVRSTIVKPQCTWVGVQAAGTMGGTQEVSCICIVNFNSLGPKFISLGHFQSIEHLNIP